jgi:hypothetical protein
MAEFLGGLALLLILAAFGVFCHGLYARARIKRYKRAATPVRRKS